MRIATIDVGTNTVLLLITEVTAGGRLVPTYEEERFVRLGEGVDAAGRLAGAAMDRVLAALGHFRDAAARHGAPVVAVGATSASRDARNVDELIRRVDSELALPYEILSGEDEAVWSFRGALSAFPDLETACVLDVGGGSTEIIAGRPSGGHLERVSLDVGGVRLTERVFGAVPPANSAVTAARRFVEAELERVPFGRGLPLVGAAGTVAALAQLISGGRDRRALHLPEVRSWLDRLLVLAPDQVRELAPDVLTGREDVFAAGVLIVEAAMRHLGAVELLPSPRGLRHGLAMRWYQGR